MQIRSALTHPLVKPLLLVFLLLNLIVTEYGGTNAKSRGAVLRAMSESHTFSITRYKDWTVDWARRPDGEYFSNKAPGPMLLGFPLYFVLDQTTSLFERGWRDELGRRKEHPYGVHVLYMLCMQLLPFCLLCALWAAVMRGRGAGSGAQLFALSAALFANTAVCFMNNNFGHGFSALLVMALGYAVWKREFFWIGLLAGFAVLSDYAVIMQLPALAAVLLLLLHPDTAQRALRIRRFIVGMLPGAILWCWYHYVCFGSIFTLPNKYQNPDMITVASKGINLFGELALPDPQVLYELLLGPSRGLLYTQPYLLLGPLALVFAKREKIQGLLPLSIFAWGSFCGLLLFNAGYGAWHGGHAPGPRYMCAIFPLLGIWFGLYWEALPRWLQVLSWISLAVAIAFRALIYAHGLLVPPVPMWQYLLEHLLAFDKSLTPLLRVGIFFGLLGSALALSFRNSRKDPALHA